MMNISEVRNALNSIRSILDIDVVDCNIQDVQNKAIKLTQLMGLSAETTASSKKILHTKEIEVFAMMEVMPKQLTPSMQAKYLKAMCKDEVAVLEYSDRLNAGIVHSSDTLRSIISLYKTEITTSLKSI